MIAHRAAVVAVSVGLALSLGSFLPRLELAAATEDMLRESDPARLRYDDFRDQFGRDHLGLLALEPPEVFDSAFLTRLRAFHTDLEDSVPHLEEVTSLVNVRSTYGRGDELVVEDLLEEPPSGPEELAALRERVMSTPSYQDGVVSRDGRLTTVVVRTATTRSAPDGDAAALAGFESGPGAEAAPQVYLTDRDNHAVMAAIEAAIERHQGPDFPVQLTGSLPLSTEVTQGMERDMPRFLLVSLAIVSLLIPALLRRVAPLLGALLVVAFSTLTTLGWMAAVGITMSPPVQIAPPFLLSVGVGYSIHLLAIFYQAIDAGKPREEAIVQALGHSGLPIAMTALTTAVGVASFVAAENAMTADFGLVCAVGVGITLVYVLLFLPAFIACIPAHPRARGPRGAPSRLEALLVSVGRFSGAHASAVVAAAAVLCTLAIVSALGLRLSMDPMQWLPEDNRFRVATAEIDRRLGGTVTAEVVLDTGRENGLHDPALLRRVDAFEARFGQRLAREGRGMGRTFSVVDIAKETHQALHANRPAYYAVADDPALLAQELFLFENSGSDDLEQFVDSQLRLARVTVRMPWMDAFEMSDWIAILEEELTDALAGASEFWVTGQMHVFARSSEATVHSMAQGYAIALALITPLMVLLIGELRAGLVSMVPNLMPILITLGLMARVDVPIDMFSMMVGVIAMGLAVDDTIHLVHGFRRDLSELGDVRLALDRTLRTTGRALLIASVVLSAGFSVFALSSMNNLADFGLLVSFAIAVAFLLDVSVTPALLTLLFRGRETEKEVVPVGAVGS